MEEENVEGSSNDFNDELNKLINALSFHTNTEHELTLKDCYAEYFDKKVKTFEHVEKRIESFIHAIASSGNSSKDHMTVVNVNKKREEFLSNIRGSFDCIKQKGFGIKRLYKSNGDTNDIEATTQAQTTSGDNFCDFILKDIDNCGKFFHFCMSA